MFCISLGMVTSTRTGMRTGRPHMVEVSRFADLLRQARPMPRLVVLNSCSGATIGQGEPVLGDCGGAGPQRGRCYRRDAVRDLRPCRDRQCILLGKRAKVRVVATVCHSVSDGPGFRAPHPSASTDNDAVPIF
jgi:hypothetical protein